MPELPEVETIRRSLSRAIIGARVANVTVARRGYITGVASARALLLDGVVTRVDRRGKQLAIVADNGRSLCLHLGMSGQVLVHADARTPDPPHTHVRWRLKPTDGPAVVMVMRDPRRFGGVWTFPTFSALAAARWSQLGPDALTIDEADLSRLLRCTRRAVKAALLDQRLLASVGNIYADESLHRARIHPEHPASRLSRRRAFVLAAAIRQTLRIAVNAKGSTIRDYRDATGQLGGYYPHRLVYGRAGEPCPTCGRSLHHGVVAQRTTVWCARCQPRPRGKKHTVFPQRSPGCP